MSVSDLVSNTSKVVSGGSFQILRQKQVKAVQNSASMKPLYNDISQLLQEFHVNDSTFKEVRKPSNANHSL